MEKRERENGEKRSVEKRSKELKKKKKKLQTHMEISMSGSSLIDSAASSEFSTSSRIEV